MKSTSTARTHQGTGPRDLLLIQTALQGDAGAVEQLLTRLSCTVRFVYRLNRALGYGMTTEALEDVVQQVYTAIWPRLVDYTGTAALESWVYGFCRNCLRAESRRRHQFPRPIPLSDLEREPPGGESRPDESLLRTEGLELLHEELLNLNPAERDAVCLRHIEGWSFEQIAQHQGLAASTVKDRCYRAIMRMKDRLGRRDVGT
jgi:RNA polymerase sigma-70 factor (ECF subfamily)